MDMAATAILFIKFPELQFHLDSMIDSVCITGTCCFILYFFFHRDFAIPLFHPLFDPTTPFITIPVYMAHPAAPVPPPASPPQVVFSLSPDDSSEVVDSSSSSSSRPGDGYAQAELGIG